MSAESVQVIAMIRKPAASAASLIVAPLSASVACTTLLFRTQKGDIQEKPEMIQKAFSTGVKLTLASHPSSNLSVTVHNCFSSQCL